MSKIESSIARMRHLQAIPVHYDMGDRYGNDADGNGRIDSLFAKYNYLEVRN
jgi:gametolysin